MERKPLCQKVFAIKGGTIFISGVRIKNYKAFRQTENINLDPGFNVIVGKNNAGKTALLECLGLRVAHVPHKSPLTVPRAGLEPPQAVEVEVDFELSRQEIERGLRDLDRVIIHRGLVHHTGRPGPTGAQFLKWDEDEPLILQARLQLTSSGQIPSLHGRTPLGVVSEVDISPGDNPPHLILTKDDDSVGWNREVQPMKPVDLVSQLDDFLKDRIYLFDAERFNVGEGPARGQHRLQPDASNLASVLLNLRTTTRYRFDRLVDLVGEVFPEVQDISIPISPDGKKARIHVWHVDPESERDDLAIPLSAAGTGIGQALGILYVLVTSSEPQVILIDEPQSFLHPGALRKLLSILRDYQEEHQFILATHAPSVISALDPGKILSVSLDGEEAQIDTVEPEESHQLQDLLGELGVRPSDLFGADNILWVEGRTEEEVFPMILENLSGKLLMGTQILSVASTGDLDSRDEKIVRQAFKLYRKLSASPVLIPPALGFIFDSEDRDDQLMRDLRREAPARLEFLPRRMYESYLLNPQAIAAVISAEDGVDPVTEAAVQERLTEYQESGDFLEGELSDDEEWIEVAHAAKLLESMFPDLTDDKLTYRKVKHGREITNWLIQNKPAELQEVVDFLEEFIQRKGNSVTDRIES